MISVTPKTVAVPYEFTGSAEGSREVEVRARVSGILLERSYVEGKPVRKGQTLFVIDPAPYRAAVAEATARRDRSAPPAAGWTAAVPGWAPYG